VSHDSGAVINLCSRALWLQQGQAQMIASPKAVAEAYLASFYEQLQGMPQGQDSSKKQRGPGRQARSSPVDQRLQFINSSSARNDIELFSFNPDASSFGKGGAQIREVALLTRDEQPLSWIVGGESVILRVQAQAQTDLSGPIIGFIVKDRLGQSLFSDNTFLTFRDAPLDVRPGELIEASFEFMMPILPMGDYSICVAIAEGTQDTHVQHHWIHDALQFKSHSSSVSTGLIGIPMSSIEMRTVVPQ
jgi:lipopolysaccharide transport system ATP-binding protein